MTVRELQELLSKCTPDTEVFFAVSEGCCGDFRELEVEDFDSMDVASTAQRRADVANVSARIQFKNLPGFRSCRQVGSTLEADKKYWEHFGGPKR